MQCISWFCHYAKLSICVASLHFGLLKYTLKYFKCKKMYEVSLFVSDGFEKWLWILAFVKKETIFILEECVFDLKYLSLCFQYNGKRKCQGSGNIFGNKIVVECIYFLWVLYFERVIENLCAVGIVTMITCCVFTCLCEFICKWK